MIFLRSWGGGGVVAAVGADMVDCCGGGLCGVGNLKAMSKRMGEDGEVYVMIDIINTIDGHWSTNQSMCLGLEWC